MSSSNGSNSRLNRIERLIEQAERANREANARHEKAEARHERAHARYEQAHARNEEAHARYEHAHARHDRDMRQLRDDLRRWGALGVKEARNLRKGIADLKATQAVTEKMLQQFIASMRGRNGHS